jgi:hypothetical protein
MSCGYDNADGAVEVAQRLLSQKEEQYAKSHLFVLRFRLNRCSRCPPPPPPPPPPPLLKKQELHEEDDDDDLLPENRNKNTTQKRRRGIFQNV